MKVLNNAANFVMKVAAHVAFFCLCWAGGLLVCAPILFLIYFISSCLADGVTWGSFFEGLSVLSFVIAVFAFIATELKVASFKEEE